MKATVMHLKGSRSLVFVLLMLSTVAAGACGSDAFAPGGPRLSLGAGHDTLYSVADAFVREAVPDFSYGQEDSLPAIEGSGDGHRSLLRFDQGQLQAAAAGSVLDSARLELTVVATTYPQTGLGVEVSRVLKEWSETAATWHCGIDEWPGDREPDCTTLAWDAGGANGFMTPATAKDTVIAGRSGTVVRFDVTPDVQAWLGGAANYGWRLSVAPPLTTTLPTSRIIFAGRRRANTAARPRLILYGHATPLPSGDAGDFPNDAAFTVTAPYDASVSYYRRLAAVKFDDSTSVTGRQAFMARFHAVAVGSEPFNGGVVVQFDDPGTAYTSVMARIVTFSPRTGPRRMGDPPTV